jgi:uridine phosphorylase
LCFRDGAPAKEAVDYFKAKPVDRKVLWGMEASRDNPQVHEAAVEGRPVLLVTGCVWGGPQAAILVEELATLGCRRVFGMGAVSGLIPALVVGDQVAAVEAPAMDGASRAYAFGSARPDPGLLAHALSAAAQRSVPLHPVKVASFDAAYRQNSALVHHWRAQGLEALAMECAAFYAAAEVRRLKALWLGQATDRLVPGAEDWNQPPPGIVETGCGILEACLRQPLD